MVRHNSSKSNIPTPNDAEDPLRVMHNFDLSRRTVENDLPLQKSKRVLNGRKKRRNPSNNILNAIAVRKLDSVYHCMSVCVMVYSLLLLWCFAKKNVQFRSEMKMKSIKLSMEITNNMELLKKC